VKTAAALFAITITSSIALLPAQEVSSNPVGSVTIEVAVGSAAGRTISVVSLPLTGIASAAGAMKGTITAVTSSTLANSAAGWTAGELSSVASPHVIRITSGAAKGRTFLISTATPNTATTVTLDSEDLSLLSFADAGISVGDSYEIIVCDTLGSVFGTPETTRVLGAANSSTADIIQVLVQGQYRQYYYNTTRNAWLRVGPETVSTNVPLRPDAAVIYSRAGQTPLQFTIGGPVPMIERKALVRNSGATLLANWWPVEITLGASGIAELPGWIKSTSAAAADTVQVNVGGAWRKYYHNGTQWLRVGPNTPSNDVVLNVGDGVLIGKQGSQAGAGTVQQNLPYNL